MHSSERQHKPPYWSNRLQRMVQLGILLIALVSCQQVLANPLSYRSEGSENQYPKAVSTAQLTTLPDLLAMPPNGWLIAVPVRPTRVEFSPQLPVPVMQSPSTTACRYPIQLQVPEGSGELKAYHLLHQWQHHPLAKPMYELGFCWQLQTYPRAVTECQQVTPRGRLQCHIQGPLGGGNSHADANQPGYRVLMVEQSGIASAAQRQQDFSMVLSLAAPVELLAHEVGHWLGLADEYAMSAPLAAAFCRGDYQHPSLNIVVTDSRQLSAEQLQQLWQTLPWRTAVKDWRLLAQPTSLTSSQGEPLWELGSAPEQIGLHAVDTCQNSDYFAWRPLAEITAMQYFDSARWPSLYLELIQQQYAH